MAAHWQFPARMAAQPRPCSASHRMTIAAGFRRLVRLPARLARHGDGAVDCSAPLAALASYVLLVQTIPAPGLRGGSPVF